MGGWNHQLVEDILLFLLSPLRADVKYSVQVATKKQGQGLSYRV